MERQKHSREQGKFLEKKNLIYLKEVESKLSFLGNEVKVPPKIPKFSCPASQNPHFLVQTFPLRVWSWKFGAREVTLFVLCWNRK